MDSSIIDVDAVADGDYLLHSEDVSDILQQFRESNLRLNDNSSCGHSFRSVDTRTFTRPKKRVMQNLQSAFPTTTESSPPLSTIHAGTFDLDETPPQTRDFTTSLDGIAGEKSINLRIGGLVTNNMDASNLGDVSPPYSSSMIESQHMMMNSLLTSGDFTGVSFLMDNKADASEVSTLKSFSRFDGDDMMSNNKSIGESIPSGNDIRVNLLRSTTFNKTLERGGKSASVNSNNCTQSVEESNDTFTMSTTVERNDTFDVEDPKLNNTFHCINSSPDVLCVNNQTISPQNQNKTFDCNDQEMITVGSIGATHLPESVGIQDELKSDRLLLLQGNDTFDLNDQEMPTFNKTKNNTFMANNTFEINDIDMQPFNEPSVLNQTQPQIEERRTCNFPISTPMITKNNVNKRHTLAFDLSPIPLSKDADDTTTTEAVNHRSIENAKKRIDLNIIKPSEDELEKFLNDGSRNTPDEVVKEFVELRQKQTHELSQEERESLMNFEEFEKSLRLIENKGNDDQELDEILNSFSSIRKSIQNDKMRQSLDNIKKRHSLINLEKQQEDLRRKEVDSNKLCDSMDKSMVYSMSSSSGERLLNRRSRYCDYNNEQVVASVEGVQDEHTKSLKEIDKDREKHIESKLSPPSCKSRYNNVSKIYLSNTINIDEVPSDNREDDIVNENSSTELENSRNRTQTIDCEVMATEVLISGKKPADRDRFKTIRIFKRGEPKPNPNIPTIDQYNVEPEPIKGISRILKRDANSPKSLQQPLDNKVMSEKEIVADKMKTFTRPTRFLSGLRKPSSSSVKSSSYDNLDKDYNHGSGANAFVGTSAVPELKSPMGIKSKSVHNLMYSSGGSQQSGSKLQYKSRLPNDKPPEFKHPQSIAITARRMQAPSALRKTANGIIRPSSGYYNYGSNNQVNHRNDSDTESGRFSPTNSLSSASSRGSLSRQDAIEGSRIRNGSLPPPVLLPLAAQTITDEPQQQLPKAAPTGGVKTGIPKPSGLRPPSTVRRSALPRPKSIVRR